jgi:hypothetical protein
MNDSHIDLRSIDISGIPENHLDILHLLFKSTKGMFRLRSAAPKYTWGKEVTKEKRAYYVWRMVMFQISNKGVHHCMPVIAGFLIPREVAKDLDQTVDYIVNQFPKEEWGGIIRWGRAMGVLN